MFYNHRIIEEKMNRAGKEQTPFLFGFNFDLSKGFFISDPLQQSNILFDVNGQGNSNPPQIIEKDFHFDFFPQSQEQYKIKFDDVILSLHRRKTKVVNLTIKTEIGTSFSMHEIFELSHARYRLLVPDRFVCFSPESFIKIKDGKISCFPMKGTIDANIPDAEKKISEDLKELEEHRFAVNLIQKDLSRVATEVQTKRFRYIDRLDNHNGSLLQVSSEVEGVLDDDYPKKIGSIITALLPAGSIAGAPKKESLKIIDQAEGESRGYYTGVFGYFDGNSLDSGVMIRFIEKENGRLFYRSGGGITVNSDCETEYREALNKIYLPIKPR